MRLRLLSATVLLLLAGCGGGGPDLAACETAMREQLQTAMADPNAAPGTKPEECEGVGDGQLEEIGGRIIGEELGG